MKYFKKIVIIIGFMFVVFVTAMLKKKKSMIKQTNNSSPDSSVNLITPEQNKVDTEDKKSFLSLPDTFRFYKATDIKYAISLNLIEGKIFDSIENPKAYFIDTYGDRSGFSWCIALKKEDKFLVFNPFENSNARTETNNLTFKRIDFNCIGNEELIIEWQSYIGHSGWENGINERNGGVLIWDLDNLTRLMDFDNFYSIDDWWTTFAPDTTGSLDYSEREVIESKSDYQYEKYNVKIEKKTVMIQRDNTESSQINNKNNQTINNIYIYQLTNSEIILIK